MKIPRTKSCRNVQQPPLFAWADARERMAYSLSAIVLSRRFGLSPQRARLIAELAGLGERV